MILIPFIPRPPSMVEGYVPDGVAPPVPTLPYASVYGAPHNWNGMVSHELEFAVVLMLVCLLLVMTAVIASKRSEAADE